VTRSARSAVPVLGIGATQYTRPKGSTVVHEWNGTSIVSKELKAGGTDDVCEWWLVITSADLLVGKLALQETRNIRRRHHWSNASRFLASCQVGDHIFDP